LNGGSSVDHPPLVHLDHPRGYSDPEKIRRHKARIAEVRRSGIGWTPDGVRKGAAVAPTGR